METLVEFIAKHPSAAVIVVALLLACVFASLLFSSFKTRTESMEKNLEKTIDKFETISERNQIKMVDMRDALNLHKDDMGKATKAIAGEFLMIKEKIFELRQDLSIEIDKVKSLAKDTQRSLELANTTSNIAIESLNEKLGRVIIIEKDIQTHSSQIVTLQEGVGSTKSTLSTHGRVFSSVAQALAQNKTRLEAIEKELKKGRNGIS